MNLTLRQAALVSGVGLLIMVVAAPFAEFAVFAELVVSGDVEATARNIRGQGGLFLAGIFAYLLVFICDVIVAWSLYLLLAPVHRSLSLLAAWFRLVYTALAMFASFKLVTVYRLLDSPDDAALFGSDQLHAQVNLLLDAFRYEWGFSLILFGIYLLLLGHLVYRAGYIPKPMGVLLGVAGLGWVVYELSPYLLPGADLGFLMVTFLGEVIFMAWLLIRGWKIPEPGAASA